MLASGSEMACYVAAHMEANALNNMRGVLILLFKQKQQPLTANNPIHSINSQPKQK